MKKILIVIPGMPTEKLATGWSVILKDFVLSLENSKITIISNFFKIYNKNKEPKFVNKKNVSIRFLGFGINIKNLFIYIYRVFFQNVSIQESIYSPILNKKFINKLKESDIIIFFTTRTILPLKNNNIEKLIKDKNIILFVLDPLSEAYRIHSINSKNYLMRYIYNFEYKRLKIGEISLPDNINKITFLNDNDLRSFRKNFKNKFAIIHPMKPKNIDNNLIKIFESRKLDYSARIIYILGNFRYSPNKISLLKLIKFFKNNRDEIKIILNKHNLKIKIVGFSSDDFKFLINKELKKLNLNDLVIMIGEVKSLENLYVDGFATLTAVDTKYGRQTKEFVSLNNLMPIIKLTNDKSDNKSYILNFADIGVFRKNIDFLVVNKNMFRIKKDILFALKKEKDNYSKFIQMIINQ